MWWVSKAALDLISLLLNDHEIAKVTIIFMCTCYSYCMIVSLKGIAN